MSALHHAVLEKRNPCESAMFAAWCLSLTRISSLYKTKRSGVDVKEEKRERLLTAAPFSGSMFHKTLYTKSSHGGVKSKGRDWSSGATAKPREGELVGYGADKIGIDNVGHKLLSKMGWAEGNKIGIGSGSGIDAP